MKKKDFLANTSIPQGLCNAVIKQLSGTWGDFQDKYQDVVSSQYGAAAGFHGFTCYSDTVKFAELNLDGIKNMAKEQALDFGIGTLEMIAGFNCLNGNYSADEIAEVVYGKDKNHDAYTQVMNALAWYALEEVCREYERMMEG